MVPLPSPDVARSEDPTPQREPSRSQNQERPLSPTQNARHHVFRAIKLTGFNNAALNVLFVENTAPEAAVGGRETYWSHSGDFFLYYSGANNTWAAGKAKRLTQVREGKNNGVAHSPDGFELWPVAPAPTRESWREWDPQAAKWTIRKGAGVETRGKWRKKDAPCEKGVQTDPQRDDLGQSTQMRSAQEPLRRFIPVAPRSPNCLGPGVPRVHSCTREELESAVRWGHEDLWAPPTYGRHARRTIVAAIALMLHRPQTRDGRERPLGGALICIAPSNTYKSVFGTSASNDPSYIDAGGRVYGEGPSIEESDDGYMTRLLRGMHASDRRFLDAFAEFSAHTGDGRWPLDHPDVAARGRPKDGALLLATSGHRLKCAAKLLGLPPLQLRDATLQALEPGLAFAWKVVDACVLVRPSDNGTISFIVRQGDTLNVVHVL